MPGSIEWEATLVALLSSDDPREAACAGGLADSLAGLVRHFCADARPIEWRVDGLDRLERVATTCFTACYCVCREALDNAVRHSGARRIAVELAVRHARLIMRVTDDGRGFEPHASLLGIARMREHARLAGGRLDVRSAPDAGTCVSLIFALGGEP